MSDRTMFVEMLMRSNIPFVQKWDELTNHWVVVVSNGGSAGGYGGFESEWRFTKEGTLDGVAH